MDEKFKSQTLPILYYNFAVMESTDEEANAARLSMDTVTRHVRNADSSRPNDLHNGRSSIPIARSSPYRAHILPERRNGMFAG